MINFIVPNKRRAIVWGAGYTKVKDSQCAAGGKRTSIHNVARSVRGPTQDRMPEECMGVWIGGLLSVHWKSIRWMTSLPQIGRGIASGRSGMADSSGTSLLFCLGGLSPSLWSTWPKAGSPQPVPRAQTLTATESRAWGSVCKCKWRQGTGMTYRGYQE